MAEQKHYRKCHVCGTLNENEITPVTYCCECTKPLAPFFYFDDKYKVVPSDNRKRPPLMDGEYPPIQGLTVYWEAV